MLVIGINGSPRKSWNTATLVDDALEGARSEGAEVERIDLYDSVYSGCRSCFACKRVGLEDRRCIVKDQLTPVLERALFADAMVLGSPIYLHETTAGFAAFMERLLFPYVTYRNDLATFCDRRVPTAFIYTMNAYDDYVEDMRRAFGRYERFSGRLLGCEAESYCSVNTLQFDDYDRYEHSAFDVGSKREWRESRFPLDREECRHMGARLVERARSL